MWGIVCSVHWKSLTITIVLFLFFNINVVKTRFTVGYINTAAALEILWHACRLELRLYLWRQTLFAGINSTVAGRTKAVHIVYCASIFWLLAICVPDTFICVSSRFRCRTDPAGITGYCCCCCEARVTPTQCYLRSFRSVLGRRWPCTKSG